MVRRLATNHKYGIHFLIWSYHLPLEYSANLLAYQNADRYIANFNYDQCNEGVDILC